MKQWDIWTCEPPDGLRGQVRRDPAFTRPAHTEHWTLIVRSKAPSPLRSAGALHTHAPLDCGGKHSATPLSPHQSSETSKSSGTFTRFTLMP
jgi:hypothetical protein